MDSTPDATPGLRAGEQYGRFRAVRPAGRGGMGEVWLGQDLRFDRSVALKVLPAEIAADPRHRERFLRTAHDAAKVVHPYVATVFDVVDRDEGPILVMEFVRGQPLDAHYREAPLDPVRARRYGAEIAEALAAIHAAGIVHRDLKPSNVMITPDDHVKVLDFGVAWRMPEFVETRTEGEARKRLTASGAVVGTIAYMSPEQLRGEPVDPRSDLFSLGIVLWEAMTGAHPFPGRTREETAAAILHREPGSQEDRRRLRDSGDTATLVLDLLQKQPDARPADATEVANRLRGPHDRRSWTWAYVAAGLVAGAGLLAVGPRLCPSPRVPAAAAAVRPSLAVLPFESSGPSDAAAGRLVADWIGATLAESSRLRAVPFDRVLELLPDLGTPRPGRVARIFRSAAPSWVVTGTTYREGDEWLATVELYDAPDRDPKATFRSRGARATELAGRIAEELERQTGAPSLAGFVTGTVPPAPRSDEVLVWVREADRARRRLEFAEAMRLYERALAVDPAYPEALVGAADAYFRAGLEGKARDAIGSALSTIASRPAVTSPRTALVATALDERIRRSPRWVEAIRSLASRYPDEPEILIERASSELSADPAEALRVADRAAAIDRSDGAVEIVRHRALVALKRVDEASAALERARALFGAAGSEAGLAQVEETAGFTAYRSSRFDEARERYTEAARLYRRAGLAARAAVCDSVVADAAVSQWKAREAFPIYTAALAELERAGHYGLVIQVLNSMGGTWIREGNAVEAEKALVRAVDEARKLGTDDRTVSPLLNLATLYVTTGRPEEALRLARKAIELAERGNDKRLALMGTLRAAIALREAGRFGESVETLRAATARPEFGSLDPSRQSLLRGFLAEILEAAERPGDALVEVRAAVDLIDRSPPPVELAYRLCCRARLLAESGDLEGGREDLARARTILASLPEAPESRNLLGRTAARLAVLAGEPPPPGEPVPSVGQEAAAWRAARAEGFALTGRADAARAEARALIDSGIAGASALLTARVAWALAGIREPPPAPLARMDEVVAREDLPWTRARLASASIDPYLERFPAERRSFVKLRPDMLASSRIRGNR